jgi:hypothetical protein
MDSDFDMLQAQISAQIIGMYTFDISYVDAEVEAFRIIETAGKGYYVWPVSCTPKRTSQFKFDQICRMSADFVADTEQRNFTIDGWFKYDDFMDNYYNVRAAISLASYIARKHGRERGAQRQFADKQGIQCPQISQWNGMKCIVVDGVLYSPRRELKR